jgi:hypothetical protein
MRKLLVVLVALLTAGMLPSTSEAAPFIELREIGYWAEQPGGTNISKLGNPPALPGDSQSLTVPGVCSS